MAPYANYEPLGSKHKHFNKQVHNAIASGKPLDEKEFTKDKNDLENLRKIDIASHNKDIEYILSVLKSDDMLYISRAIKQGVWIVDDQFANIINPQHLKEHLFPYMKTKATIKLIKHIRQHLKTENRVEEFYINETNPKAAAKWLSRCSVPFIEKHISKHKHHITDLEFKRLCARSVTIFEAALKNNYQCNIKAVSFLLHTHANTYLDVFENFEKYSCFRSDFGPTATELLMKKAPERIINNFLKYVDYIHIPTFINYIKREQIKDFLIQIANAEDKEIHGNRFYSFFQFRIIKQFVVRMPKEEQFEFVKKVFLNKENILDIPDDTLQRGTELFAIKKICKKVIATMPSYHWYVFAPFEKAFDEIKKLIHAESNYTDMYPMLYVLLDCAAKNTDDLLVLLTYYSKNNKNDDMGLKRDFINKLLSQAEMYKVNEEIWNIFMDIIKNMSITTINDNQEFIEIIMLHDVINNKQVTEEVEKRFLFNTFKRFRKSLNKDDQSRVFEYLYNYLVKKAQDHNIETEVEFREFVGTVEHLLDLLLDWEKDLSNHQFVLDEIKTIIRIRKENAWKIDLSSLYNKKKSWRKLMFEESVVLDPSQKVLINALKHDPNLLKRYESDVETISCNDAVSLKQLLRKIRIYWPDTLSDCWSKSYIERLDKLGGFKALTRGLCILLSQEQFLDIVKKYAPAHPKIDWNNTNELTLGLQRYFAKNMHIARPQPPADIILMYAKGDFLQYALPSLLAIYYNMGRVESQVHIPKLLSGPVSIQKHGLRLAFIKLKHEELKFHLFNIWQATKNISIRAVTFVLLFELMCKEKDEAKAEELWQILDVFIDNLSYKEDKKIYLKLDKIDNIPESIKPKFLVKSYTFLKSLLPHISIDVNVYQYAIKNLALYTRNIMKSVNPDFVANIITEYLDAHFFKNNDTDDMLGVISSYLLCANDEETQLNKYEQVFVPVITRAITEWNQEEKHFIKKNFQSLLTYLYNDLFNYVIKNKMVIPTKMFQRIEKDLNTLALPPNYIIIRMWKLVVKLTEIIGKVDDREDWQQISPIMVPELGKLCLDILKDDVKAHFPCIYVLFSKVLKITVQNVLPEDVCLPIYEVLLSDNDFVQAYLVVLQMLNERGHYSARSEECDVKEDELKKAIREHPSVEVRMHYYSKYVDDKESLGI